MTNSHRTRESVLGRRSAASCTTSLAWSRRLIRPLSSLQNSTQRPPLLSNSSTSGGRSTTSCEHLRTRKRPTTQIKIAKDVCNKAWDINRYRTIIAHASFEPTDDGVQFSRAVT